MSKNKTIDWSPIKGDVDNLKPNEYNPNKMDEKEKRDLKNSIKKFGPAVPIVLNTGKRKNIIIGGEQRVLIYKELGIKKVDCVIPDRELTELEEKELSLRLNKNVGHLDEDLLKVLGIEMLIEVGCGDEELQNLFDDVDVIEDDFRIEKALEETKVIKVKTGQIWELGDHRILVGDSTNEDDVKRMMNGDLADLCYFDSPYNIGLSYSKSFSNTKNYGGSYSAKDDSKKDEDFSLFLDKSLQTALSVVKPNAHFFYWTDSSYIWLAQTLYKKHGLDSKRVCLWIKNNANCTPKNSFNKCYEPCTHATLGKPYLNKNMNNVNEILNQEITTGNQVHDEILDMIDLWIDKRDNTSQYLHPTQKPVSLSEKPFKRCSAPGHIIFSGFAGSGSDLIACEELKRKWRGVEKDLVFATIVIDRWEKFTGKKAKLLYENN